MVRIPSKHIWWLLVGIVGLCFLAIAIPLFGPKEIPLSMNPRMFTGYYWGNDSILGRHFYKVRADEGSFGYWEVEVKGSGYSSYRGYYPDGTIREIGEIMVKFGDIPPEPQPDETDVKWGKYFRPDGTLASEVQDGTGEMTLWHPNGQIRWRLILKDYERVEHEHWDQDGTSISKQTY